MRWFRSRRHSHDDWIDAIKPELRDLPVPSPRDDLFADLGEVEPSCVALHEAHADALFERPYVQAHVALGEA